MFGFGGSAAPVRKQPIKIETMAKRQRGNPMIALVPGPTRSALPGKIANKLGVPLTPIEHFMFNSGEPYIRAMDSLRYHDVFLIQTHNPPNLANDLISTFILCQALKLQSVSSLTVVKTYHEFSRQERKDKPHAPISAKWVADNFNMLGVDNLITMNLHAAAIEGYYKMPLHNLMGEIVLTNHISRMFGRKKSWFFASPDVGRIKMAKRSAEKAFKKDSLEHTVVISKGKLMQMGAQAVADESFVASDPAKVRGRAGVLIDDIIDGGTTMFKAAQALKKAGADEIYAAGVHPVLSKGAVEKLISSGLFAGIFVTDTIELDRLGELPSMFKVVSLAPFLAEVIKRTFVGQSLSDLREVG